MTKYDAIIFNHFMSGAVMLGYWASGYFFLRFWKKTNDRFFLTFAAAFFVLTIERVILISTDPQHEFRFSVYLVRLAAFVLMIFAIYQKNRPNNGD